MAGRSLSRGSGAVARLQSEGTMPKVSFESKHSPAGPLASMALRSKTQARPLTSGTAWAAGSGASECVPWI
jgi:hypothetical protein